MEAPLIVGAVLAFVAFFIWNRTKDNLERRRTEIDAQAKMLERTGPGDALTGFLQTEEGKHFFDRLTASHSEPVRSNDQRSGVIVLTTLSVIALFFGFFMGNALLMPNLLVADPEISLDVLPIVAMPAVSLTGAGVATLIAASTGAVDRHATRIRHARGVAADAVVAGLRRRLRPRSTVTAFDGAAA